MSFCPSLSLLGRPERAADAHARAPKAVAGRWAARRLAAVLALGFGWAAVAPSTTWAQGGPLGKAPTAAAQSRAAAPAVADGLLVRLKGAQPHPGALLGGRELAQARVAPQSDDPDRARFEHLVDAAGLGARAGRTPPARSPVGRDWHLLRFAAPLDAAQTAALSARLRADPAVEAVVANTRERRMQVGGLPNDPYVQSGDQWWVLAPTGSDASPLAQRRRGAPNLLGAWLAPGGTGVQPAARVAVLDSGITAHPELAGRIVGGWDFVSDTEFSGDGNGRDSDPRDPGDAVTAADLLRPAFRDNHCTVEDSSWHGTTIAGVIAAQTHNGEGVAGIHWAGQVVPVRVAGKCGASVSDITDAMRWAAGLPVPGAPVNPYPARIISISFGGSEPCNALYQETIDELRTVKGALVIAAAGNEHTHPTRPASCRNVMGVAGLNRDGFKAHYSNFGSALAAHGIATVAGDDADPSASPGEAARWSSLADDGILTLTNTGTTVPLAPGYLRVFGTSFSAPIVAGTASLMLSINPSLSWDALVAGLRVTARPHVTSPVIGVCSQQNPGRCLCTTDTCGAGILDAEQAVLYAANPSAYVPPPRSPAVLDSVELRAAAALGPDRLSNVPTPTPPPPAPVPGTPEASGGGGAVGLEGVLALGLLAAWALRVARRADPAARRRR